MKTITNKHILIGRGGKANVHLASKFSVSHDDVYVLLTKNNTNINFFILHSA